MVALPFLLTSYSNNMAAKRKSGRKPAKKSAPRRLSAANSGGVMLAKGKPKRRSRRRSSGGASLHAGMNVTAMIKPALMAVAGGVAGKILRNAIPQDLAPEIRAGAVVAAGIVAGTVTKSPMFAAGMVGSGGAYYIATIGERMNIPLLKAPGTATTYVRLAENQPTYLDENGQPLICREGRLYRSNGALFPYTPNQMIQL